MATTASSPKQDLLELIQGMPDDSSYEESLQEIVIARMVDRGLADVDAGRSVSDEEIRSNDRVVARRIVWTPESRWWLREIYDYLSREASREIAFKVVRGIVDRARLLLDFPELGHRYERARGQNVRTLL